MRRRRLVGIGQASIPETVVQAVARAIATAEGFFVAGALPQRANNPGNLMLGDIGFGMINGKTIYASAADGWNALYHQVRLMFTGASRYYHPELTLREIAEIYTGGDNPISWATNVARSLGVSIETKLKDLLGSGGGPGPSSDTAPPDAGAGSSSSGTVAILIVGAILLYLAVR